MESFSNAVKKHLIYNLSAQMIKILSDFMMLEQPIRGQVINDPIKGYNLIDQLYERNLIDSPTNACKFRDTLQVMHHMGLIDWKDTLHVINQTLSYAFSNISAAQHFFVPELTTNQLNMIGKELSTQPYHNFTMKGKRDIISEIINGIRNPKPVINEPPVEIKKIAPAPTQLKCDMCNITIKAELNICNCCENIVAESKLIEEERSSNPIPAPLPAIHDEDIELQVKVSTKGATPSAAQTQNEPSDVQTKKITIAMTDHEVNKENLNKIDSLIIKLDEMQLKETETSGSNKGECQICHTVKVLVLTYNCGAQRCCIDCIKQHLLECRKQTEPRCTCPHCRSGLTDVILVNRDESPSKPETPKLTQTPLPIDDNKN